MSILDDITRDLDWREGEIASMRLLLSRPDLSPLQRETLLRAAWALLYAHYEGFCKNSLGLFYGEVSRLCLQCRELPAPTQALALDSAIKDLRSMTTSEALDAIRLFEANHFCNQPAFGEVDTKSNLWPDLLVDLLNDADLHSNLVQSHRTKLRTLVSRRNDIAHGQRNLIKEIGYYLEYEQAVYDVMYDIALCIDSRLKASPYNCFGNGSILAPT